MPRGADALLSNVVVYDLHAGLNFVPELLSLLPLGAALYLIWREHRRLRSLLPFVLGVAFLLVARASDVLIQLPPTAIPHVLGLAHGRFDQILNAVSDLTDTAGVFLFVFGFVQTIRYERTTHQRINDLESLLPICAWCKRYRTDDGEWKPIEKLLTEGGQTLTHGICPDCRNEHFG